MQQYIVVEPGNDHAFISRCWMRAQWEPASQPQLLSRLMPEVINLLLYGGYDLFFSTHRRFPETRPDWFALSSLGPTSIILPIDKEARRSWPWAVMTYPTHRHAPIVAETFDWKLPGDLPRVLANFFNPAAYHALLDAKNRPAYEVWFRGTTFASQIAPGAFEVTPSQAPCASR